ncbi:E3 ubiquitin-protein ligase ATL6-like [Fagus crenata]
MRVMKIEISREDGYGITWAHLVLVSLVIMPEYLHVNAEPSTETPDSDFEFEWENSQSRAIITVILVCAFALLVCLSIFLRKCARARLAAARNGRSDFNSDSSSPAAVGTNLTRRRGLDKAVIQTFPTFTYSVVKGLKFGKDALECAVCLSEFEDHETLRLLPRCNHVFHPDCIDTWLGTRVTCPVCRTRLAPDDSETNHDSLQSTESGSYESTQEIPASQLDHVVVNVEENESRDENRLPITKLPRSHSTGHSLSQPEDNTERYTLRLPEEVRKQVLECVELERSTSNGVVFEENVDRQVGRPVTLVREGNVTDDKTFLTSVKTPLDCNNLSAMSPV